VLVFIAHVAQDLGVLTGKRSEPGCRQALSIAGKRGDWLTTAEREEITVLSKENVDLRRGNRPRRSTCRWRQSTSSCARTRAARLRPHNMQTISVSRKASGRTGEIEMDDEIGLGGIGEAQQRAASQRAIDSGHADMAPQAAYNLGVLLAGQGDVGGSRVAFQRAIDSGHADMAPMAANNLGLLLAWQGDVGGSRVAYQRGEAKRRPVWGYFVVAGLLALAFVLTVVNQGSEPTCDGKTMHPGDNCLVYSGNDSHTDTYEEAKRAEEQAPYWLGGAAAVFALIGCVVGATRKPLSPQARKAPEPQPERQAWETAFAQLKAREIEQRLASTSPEKREEMRAVLEQGFDEGAAKYQKKRGWTGSG